MARFAAPEALVARTRTEEAKALRVGSGSPTVNPDLSLMAGPRYQAQQTTTDFFATLQWPFDLTGAPSSRSNLAEQEVGVAQAQQNQIQQRAIEATLGLWLQADAADKYALAAQAGASLDDALLRVTQVRRDAGAVGDMDLALIAMLKAEGRARLHAAQGERDAALALLKARLQIPNGTEIVLENDFEAQPALESLAALISELPQRPDIKHARAAIKAAEVDVELQSRLGRPVPRLSLAAGRSIEYTFEFGLDVPLPVYQRNQTNTAVSLARSDTRLMEAAVALRNAEAELTAAYVRYQACLQAYDDLESAAPSIADVERMSSRSYELGQGSLADVVMVRREAATTRIALLNAKLSLDRARLALDIASGVLQ